MKYKLLSFFIGSCLSVPIIIIASKSWTRPEQCKDIDYSQYVINETADIETQVLGVDYKTDFVPAYYSDEVPELHIEATAYCYGEVTKSGKKVREGFCAMKEEWIGLTAIVYEDFDGSPGDLIGIYEVEDTGFGRDLDGDGYGDIEEGKVIDIYIPDYESAKEFGRQNVIVYLLDAKG